MPANFPNNPATNQLYSYSGATWKFTGTKWQLVTVTDGNTGTLFTYSNTAPQAPSLGDRWLNSETLRQSIYINDGDTDQWVEPVSIGLAGAAKSLNNLANVSINTSLLPAANVTHDLGSSSLRWRDLYLSGNSIILGAATLTSTGSAVNLPAGTTVGGQNVATSGDVSTGGGPKITNLQITDNSWAVLDDTAVDTAGGYVLITGTNFVSGALVYLNQTPATSVAFVSATTLRVTVPALTAGTYVVYVINPDGGTAIRVPGLTASANPAWLTASALPEQYDGAVITLNLVATEATTYTLTSGSLPPGLSLNSNTGVITGTVTGVTVDTTYTFTVRATDAQLQDSPRTFTVTITVSDAYFKLTTLLLSGSAISANTVVRDSSTNNFNLTVYGDSRASNFTPYGTGWSVYFDGTGDYLGFGSNNPLPATGDFTFECWIYLTSLPGVQAAIIGNQNQSNRYMLWVTNTGSVSIQVGPSFSRGTGNNAVAANKWYHIATTRTGTTHNLFIDGVAPSLTTSGSSPASIDNTEFFIGINYNSTYALTGYISNFRVVSQILYSTTFTTPTQPLTAITNTSLLTCHANRFIDSSTNNFAITRNGDARVVSFNPFNITNTGVNGSIYLDGTGDYVTTPTSQAPLALDTANFTVECWVYFSSGQPQTNPCILSSSVGSSLANTILLQFGTQPSTQIALWVNNVHLTASATNNNLVFNAWNHIAVCRTGGSTYSFFINGIAVNSVASNSTSLTANDWRLGYWFSGAHALLGYIADFRIIKGTALYSGNFTPPTAPLTAVANTQLLTLQYDQPPNNHTFLDSSSNQFLITRNGNATQGTFSPFSQSGWSVYINNGTSSQIRISDNAALRIGTSAFTIESWVYPTGFGEPFYILRKRVNGNVGAGTWAFTVATNGSVLLEQVQGPATIASTSAGLVALNTWTHVAVSRDSSNNVKIFVNGTIQATATSSYNFNDASNPISLLCDYDGRNASSIGYASNLRFVIGSAVYTANFTPATSNLTSSSQGAVAADVKILTFQDNRFRDASTNNFTITISGSPSVQAFSPFAPTAVYSPVTHGGSAYFDGSGDYLWCLNNVVKQFEPSPSFTFEVWYYDDSTSTAGPAIFEIGGTTLNWNASTGLHIQLNTNYLGNQYFQWSKGDGATTTYSWTAPSSYQWNHFAACYNGTTTSGWLNGTRVFTSTTGWPVPNYDRFSVGGNNVTPGSYFKGYVSNLRWISGTALYDVANTSIVVPTAPLTSLSNTKLLLNFTDAAILDSTGRNVIETSGDAKVTTIQTKFGTTSQFYNGSNTNLVVPVQPYFSFPGTTSFTVEAWVYFNDLNTQLRPLIALGDGANGSGPIYMAWSIQYWGTEGSNQISWGRYDGTSYTYLTSGLSLVANTWYHIAVSRDSANTLRIFVNGTSYYSASVTQTFAQINSNPLRIGLSYNGPQAGYGGPRYFNGYIDGIRITQGYARYTDNFSPPTAPARLK